MKKNKFYILVLIITILLSIGCTSKIKTTKTTKTNKSRIEESINESDNMESLNITINNESYKLILENNDTSKDLINLLPLDLTMNELNGNEKYVYLDNTLTTNEISPKHISTGDVMLFGDNCLVIFYKSFDTSYSYTKIGHIDNLPDLDNEDIKVIINK